MLESSKRPGLGHNLLLGQALGGVMMIPAAKRGLNILLDPVFSEHCADRAAAITSFFNNRRRTRAVV